MRAAFLFLAAFSASAAAETVDRVEVTHGQSRYRIELQARLDAPLDDAYAVFRDFRNLPRINDAVEEVTALPAVQPGTERWRTTVRVCVSFFCSQLKQVQDVRDSRDAHGYRLDATVVPALSNLRYGTAAWRLDRCGAQTCLWFHAELEPDFWIPPLIGPWLIERAMQRQAKATAHGIEALALARAKGLEPAAP
ncbi:SRPBCC family protein [Solimonas variicoloris]|uniref:SRPBCC family protein n=1 Tax=Solimonas variicoloris TaxID=254408 RepID=UPI0003804BD8|nr:SRPBCC family protein [Solimonas variicoloris]